MSGTVTQSGTRNNTKETTVGYFATGTVIDSEILNNTAGMTRWCSPTGTVTHSGTLKTTLYVQQVDVLVTHKGTLNNSEETICDFKHVL
jgi:hypothetical protein